MKRLRSSPLVRRAACALAIALWATAFGCGDPTSPLDDVSLVAEYQGEPGSAPLTVSLHNDSRETLLLLCDHDQFVAQRLENDEWSDLGPTDDGQCRAGMDMGFPAGATLIVTVFDVSAPEPGTYRFVVHVRLESDDNDVVRTRRSNALTIGN